MKEDKEDKKLIAFEKKWLFRQVDIMIWSSFAAGVGAGAILAIILYAL
jgi:hypothetical protein